MEEPGAQLLYGGGEEGLGEFFDCFVFCEAVEEVGGGCFEEGHGLFVLKVLEDLVISRLTDFFDNSCQVSCGMPQIW